MRSGDATFPGYWIGILRKPSRVRGIELPLRHSQRCSLGLPSIQEQLDPCSSFPVSFLLVENASLSFPLQLNQPLFINLNWHPCFLEPGTTLFQFTHSSSSSCFCWPGKISFLFCYPTQTQNAGSTYIMHRNAENRLGQWPQSYNVTFVPLSTIMPFLWGDCLCI